MTNQTQSWRWLVLLVSTTALLGSLQVLEPTRLMGQEASGPEGRLSFEAEIRPILKAMCFQCHGEEPELKGKLDVRLVRFLQNGGESGAAIVPGNASESLLWKMISNDTMPEGAKKLKQEEKQKIFDWIQQGANTLRPEPNDLQEAPFTEEELRFWAFQPVMDQTPPELKHGVASNPIDRFIESKLREKSLPVGVPASRAVLIRRVAFDLTGLPPTPEEIEDFVADSSEDAIERMIDSYLASPQYGVRWSRHWLDVAGYAESDKTNESEVVRPFAWHYRDYVTRSLNMDKPYDLFVQEQLAGDEMIPAEEKIDGKADRNNPIHVDRTAATGFLRMAPDGTQTSDTLMDRNQAVADVIQVIGTSLMGLTVGCAQCHDHRYDPIRAEDYYALRAIFDPAFSLQHWKKPDQRLVDMTPKEIEEERARIETQAKTKEDDIKKRTLDHCQMIQDRELALSPEDVRDSLRSAVNLESAKQTPEQKRLLDQYPRVKPIPHILGLLVEYDGPAFRKFEAESKEVAAIRATKPLERKLMTIEENVDALPESHLFFRGDPRNLKQKVAPSEIFVLARHGNPDIPVRLEGSRTSGRRLAYAKHLTDGNHPLVARAIVNRIWAHHFGVGIVDTPGDFGFAGGRPSHPELLDYLAKELVDHDWQWKWLHRLILTSNAYQRSSQRNDAMDAVDPENRYLGRMNLRRLDAESIRDALLASAGVLDKRLAGASVPVDEDSEGKAVLGVKVLRDGLQTGVTKTGPEEYRRSLYIQQRRKLPLNMLDTFDLPDLDPNCQQRRSTTVAQQSLWFLNDQAILKYSETMAERLVSEHASDLEAQMRSAFLRLFGQLPQPLELEACRQFVQDQMKQFEEPTEESLKKRFAEKPEAKEILVISTLCQILMASNRFLYLD